MSNRFAGILTLIAALALSGVALGQTEQQRRGGASANAATPNTSYDPNDLSGVWQLASRTLTLTAGPDGGGDPPPMTPWGKAKFDSYKPGYGPRAVPPALGNDPMGICDPLGLPVLLFHSEGPVRFFQIPGGMLQLFTYHVAWRTIWMDGRELPKDPNPAWMGYAVGKWVGDTFVIDSNGYDERSWIDHFGDPHSDQMTIEERWHRADHDTLELTMTLTDPKTYTKPWISEKKIFKLQPGIVGEVCESSKPCWVDEQFCVPSEENYFNSHMRNPAAGKQE